MLAALPAKSQAFRKQPPSAKGQTLVVAALTMLLLLLFVGLGVDVANLMGKRAKLQSAVDAAALSAAQTLGNSSTVDETRTKARQMVEANGVPSLTLSVPLSVTVLPGAKQVTVYAVQGVETFFMRLAPGCVWCVVDVSAGATADLNAYAEISAKPYGLPGIVSELSLQTWGKDSWRRGGDAYSPQYEGNSGGVPISNTLYSEQPYGYLYRIDVPLGYPSDRVHVEIFDPDSYNRSGTPPPWPTNTPCPAPIAGTPVPCFTPVTTPTPGPLQSDMFASCVPQHPYPPSGTPVVCTSNDTGGGSPPYWANPGMRLKAFPSTRGGYRTAFWRVDERRTPYNVGNSINASGDENHATTTRFTLWHFNPRINSALGDPAQLSDLPGQAYIARFTIGPGVPDDTSGTTSSLSNPSTDLRWYQPNGFDIDLNAYDPELNGGKYFYLYVQGIAGSSENDYDIRVGPPQQNSCAYTDALTERHCYINSLYYDNWRSSWPDWDDGSSAGANKAARVFAKRALPLNLNAGDEFPLTFTQVSKNASGQTLGVRHFDQDCNRGCGSPMVYEMQICNCAAPDPFSDDSCWQQIADGYVGDNNSWVAPAGGAFPNGYPNPEPVRIPIEGSALYTTFFGNAGQCETSWLRIKRNPSYANDTTVWEMPFIRPRLVK